jgi:hypothetical protein
MKSNIYKLGIIVLIIVIVIVLFNVIKTTQKQKLPTDGVVKPEPIEMLEKAQKADLIIVDYPRVGEVVGNPISISGKARGYWFFEGDFPVVVTNWNGLIIGEGYATAQGEWMTEEYVPFTASISYDATQIGPYPRGTLILKKDNPSDMPEFDDALEYQINFNEL